MCLAYDYSAKPWSTVERKSRCCPSVPYYFPLLCSLAPWLALVMVSFTGTSPGHCSLGFEGKMGLFKPLLTSDLREGCCHSVPARGLPWMSSCMGMESLQGIWLFLTGLQSASKTHIVFLRPSGLSDRYSELSPQETNEKSEHNQGLPKQ